VQSNDQVKVIFGTRIPSGLSLARGVESPAVSVNDYTPFTSRRYGRSRAVPIVSGEPILSRKGHMSAVGDRAS